MWWGIFVSCSPTYITSLESYGLVVASSERRLFVTSDA